LEGDAAFKNEKCTFVEMIFGDACRVQLLAMITSSFRCLVADSSGGVNGAFVCALWIGEL
jgi:hypothetical protein